VFRYYKFIFPTVKFLKLDFWFNIHRPLMISVPIISIAAFIIILSYLDWDWVDSDRPLSFVHSILGIIVIFLSIVQVNYNFILFLTVRSFLFSILLLIFILNDQVIIAFFRPDKTHPKRFIFNYFHRTVGLSAFFLSIITILLGTLIEKMNLDKYGWCIMIGWIVWVIVLPLSLEVIELVFASRNKRMSIFAIEFCFNSY
jgi:hypothetical protein